MSFSKKDDAHSDVGRPPTTVSIKSETSKSTANGITPSQKQYVRSSEISAKDSRSENHEAEEAAVSSKKETPKLIANGGKPEHQERPPEKQPGNSTSKAPERSNGQQRPGGESKPEERSSEKQPSNSTSKALESGPIVSRKRNIKMLYGSDRQLPQRIRNMDAKLIDQILCEIVDEDISVRWDDIAGLENAKKCVTETIVWPLLRPDIFHGVRSSSKGILLFGPPGTGKTMIGKAIASEIGNATFFNVSPSSLKSRWMGESEKLVRTLFEVARCFQPSIIFIDEIDSILNKRYSDAATIDHTSGMKNQLFAEMDGINTGSNQVLVIGTTNRPQVLDEAARRRLSIRAYVPLPSEQARIYIVNHLLTKLGGQFQLSENDYAVICHKTEGYSGWDMTNVVKEASMIPLRDATEKGMDIRYLKLEDLRPVTIIDIENALQVVKPSVSPADLQGFAEWNKQFGSFSF